MNQKVNNFIVFFFYRFPCCSVSMSLIYFPTYFILSQIYFRPWSHKETICLPLVGSFLDRVLPTFSFWIHVWKSIRNFDADKIFAESEPKTNQKRLKTN